MDALDVLDELLEVGVFGASGESAAADPLDSGGLTSGPTVEWDQGSEQGLADLVGLS